MGRSLSSRSSNFSQRSNRFTPPVELKVPEPSNVSFQRPWDHFSRQKASQN